MSILPMLPERRGWIARGLSTRDMLGGRLLRHTGCSWLAGNETCPDLGDSDSLLFYSQSFSTLLLLYPVAICYIFHELKNPFHYKRIFVLPVFRTPQRTNRDTGMHIA